MRNNDKWFHDTNRNAISNNTINYNNTNHGNNIHARDPNYENSRIL